MAKASSTPGDSTGWQVPPLRQSGERWFVESGEHQVWISETAAGWWCQPKVGKSLGRRAGPYTTLDRAAAAARAYLVIGFFGP